MRQKFNFFLNGNKLSQNTFYPKIHPFSPMDLNVTCGTH